MGGYGSGSWQTSRKTVESSARLSCDYLISHEIGYENMTVPRAKPRLIVLSWKRTSGAVIFAGFLFHNLDGSAPHLITTYAVTDTATGATETIRDRIGFTPVHHSNAGRAYMRWFFDCPMCHRRVSKLYLPPNELHFACRHCHDLRYQAQIETRAAGYLAGYDAQLSREGKIEETLKKLRGSRKRRRERLLRRLARLFGGL